MKNRDRMGFPWIVVKALIPGAILGILGYYSQPRDIPPPHAADTQQQDNGVRVASFD